MFEFVKKWFFTGLAFLSTLTSVNSLSCISINNQECKVRPQIVNVNNILLVLKQANALVVAIMSKMCVPDVAKNWNVKAFNLMSRSNETRHYIGYITIRKIDDCESVYSVNALYLLVNHASGYIEEKNGNKYLIFDDSVNENKGLLKNTQMFGMELKMKSKQ